MDQTHQQLKEELAQKQAEARKEALLSPAPKPEAEQVVAEHDPSLPPDSSSPSARIRLKTILYLSLFVTGFSFLVIQTFKDARLYLQSFKARLADTRSLVKSRFHTFLKNVLTLGSLFGSDSTAIPSSLPENLTQIKESLAKIKSPTSKFNTLLQEAYASAGDCSRLMTSETYMSYGSFETMYGTSKCEALTKVMSEVRNDIRSIKGVLLSSRNFPSVGSSK